MVIPNRLTYGNTDLLREAVEQIIGTETPSLLEAFHATEMVVQNYRSQLRALVMQILDGASAPGPVPVVRISTLIIRNSPDEIDKLMRNVAGEYFTE